MPKRTIGLCCRALYDAMANNLFEVKKMKMAERPTGEQNRQQFVLKKGSYEVVATYCPFCGAVLLDRVKGELEKQSFTTEVTV